MRARRPACGPRTVSVGPTVESCLLATLTAHNPLFSEHEGGASGPFYPNPALGTVAPKGHKSSCFALTTWGDVVAESQPHRGGQSCKAVLLVGPHPRLPGQRALWDCRYEGQVPSHPHPLRPEVGAGAPGPGHPPAPVQGSPKQAGYGVCLKDGVRTLPRFLQKRKQACRRASASRVLPPCMCVRVTVPARACHCPCSG